MERNRLIVGTPFRNGRAGSDGPGLPRRPGGQVAAEIMDGRERKYHGRALRRIRPRGSQIRVDEAVRHARGSRRARRDSAESLARSIDVAGCPTTPESYSGEIGGLWTGYGCPLHSPPHAPVRWRGPGAHAGRRGRLQQGLRAAADVLPSGNYAFGSTIRRGVRQRGTEVPALWRYPVDCTCARALASEHIQEPVEQARSTGALADQACHRVFRRPSGRRSPTADGVRPGEAVAIVFQPCFQDLDGARPPSVAAAGTDRQGEAASAGKRSSARADRRRYRVRGLSPLSPPLPGRGRAK